MRWVGLLVHREPLSVFWLWPACSGSLWCPKNIFPSCFFLKPVVSNTQIGGLQFGHMHVTHMLIKMGKKRGQTIHVRIAKAVAINLGWKCRKKHRKYIFRDFFNLNFKQLNLCACIQSSKTFLVTSARWPETLTCPRVLKV